MLKRWALLVVGAATIAYGVPACGFSRQSTIRVRNASRSELRNVVVSGSGFRETIPTLAPGEIVVLADLPKQDTAIAVEFDAEGRHFSAPSQGYAGGGGYRVEVEVAHDLAVSILSTVGV